MKRKTFILSGILIVGGLFVGYPIYLGLKPATQKDVIQQVFRNQQNYDAIAASTNVTAQLLHRRENAFEGVKLSSYISEPPVRISSNLVQQVRALVQSPSSYKFSNAKKACIPDYGVLLNFYSPKQPVRIALCFECNMLGVFNGTNNDQEPINYEEDFDPARGKFVAVVKAIFPNDPEIQALQENRTR